MNSEEIKRAREICDAATPGPWVFEGDKDCGIPMRFGTLQKDIWIGQIFSRPKYVYHDVVGDFGEEDGKFIAEARTLLPRALDALEQCCVECQGQEEELFHVKNERNKLRSEVERLKCVPGHFECKKCGFYLVSKTIYVQSGTIGMNGAPNECLNGCGPMWRVSWMDYSDKQHEAQEAMLTRAEKAEQKFQKALDEIERLKDRLDPQRALAKDYGKSPSL